MLRQSYPYGCGAFLWPIERYLLWDVLPLLAQLMPHALVVVWLYQHSHDAAGVQPRGRR